MRFERSARACAMIFSLVSVLAGVAAAQDQPAKQLAPTPKLPGTDRKPKALTEPLPDLTKVPSIFTMDYAHLDTEWNWDYVSTIGEYLPKTMQSNFKLFAEFPDYIFNFTGANRYRMMKEYYPADYAKVKAYVAAGRWFPAGSSMEEGDVNAPSSEAILRQFLYGNEYFRKEFGKASMEFMLPDCFGFPWSLPTLLAHAGLKGFSTQKLVWGSSVPAQPNTPYAEEDRGIPFNFGIWQGPDGNSVILAANPGTYGGTLRADWSPGTQLDNSIPGGRGGKPQQSWNARLAENKQQLGLITDYHYLGTGDTGGSPDSATVYWLQKAIDAPNPVVKMLSTNADQFFLAITPTERKKLPSYSGEMELQNHSAGSLTSEAYIKRWIRRNETLADAAEKASVTAMWLGDRSYPMSRLNDAWTLVMGSHFHDIAAGTANIVPYEYAWNDQIISLNQFAGVLTSATEGVAERMETSQAQGIPVVVYNSLSVDREDLVEATLTFPSDEPQMVHVVWPSGAEVPSQVEAIKGNTATVVFSAKAPSVGYAVYDVRSGGGAATAASELKVTTSSLENARYRVQINGAGDVSSIFDKKLNKELLSAPARLAFLSDTPSQWPAWNMDFDDASRPPRGYVDGPVKVAITENGAARVAVTVERSHDKSKFVQTIRLAAGDAGNRVEFSNAIDWQMDSTVVKAVFPLTATNDFATYNLGVGTIKRSTMYDRKFEVGTHQWIDLTDRSGGFGATILTDVKNGSDKPDASTLRLSLISSPGIPGGPNGSYSYQAWQDWGHHDILYGIAGHSGDYRAGQTDWQGMRLNQPLIAFQSATKHAGSLGKTFSLVKINNPRVQVMALKRAELSDEVIIRINELDGNPQKDVRVTFAAPIAEAREVNGQEQPLGAATVTDGSLVTSFTPYTLRTFALRLAPTGTPATAPTSRPVTLSYDLAVASHDSTPPTGGFDAQGRTLPAEMLPTSLAYGGITFKLAPAMEGKPNAVVTRGQTLTLPAGYKRVYLLAASSDGDRKATFRVGDATTELTVQDWGGFVGQWFQREMKVVAPSAADSAVARAAQARADAALRDRVDSVRRAGGDTYGGPQRTGRPWRWEAVAGRDEAAPGALRNSTVLDSVNPAFVKTAPIAWFASHRHTPLPAPVGGGGGGGGRGGRGAAVAPATPARLSAVRNDIYSYSYLFAYAMDIPAGATTLTLPNDDKIRILAVTVANEPTPVTPAQPLFDHLGSK